MLTSNCANCGMPKERANYGDPFCPSCTTIDREAQQHYAAEHPDATQSDILYAGRMARQARALHPTRNYIDPRDFSAARRQIGSNLLPVPPQGGNRGVPGQ